MKKKHQPYKHLPFYLVIRGSRVQDSRTGKWLSQSEIEAYTSPKEVKTKDKEPVVKPQWWQKYKNY